MIMNRTDSDVSADLGDVEDQLLQFLCTTRSIVEQIEAFRDERPEIARQMLLRLMRAAERLTRTP